MARTPKIEQQMRDSFTGIDTLKTDLASRVAAINAERDQFINDETIKVVTESYLKAHYRDYEAFINGGGTREEYVRNHLTLDQKLEIITEYEINSQLMEGNNAVESKLHDIAGRKKDSKSQYREEAIELVGMYEKVLTENKSRIERIRQDIERTKSQIAEAEKQLQVVMGKDDESIAFAGRVSGKFDKDKAKSQLEAHIAELKGKLTKQERQFEELSGIQARMEAEFIKRKVEIENFLKAQNIYAFREAPVVPGIGDNGEPAEEKHEDKEKAAGDSTLLVSLSERETARSMFRDFRSADPERQRKLLARNGGEDIVKMARMLGPIQRREFARIMRERLSELPGNDVAFTDNNGARHIITRERLERMSKMPQPDMMAIRQEIDRVNEHFSEMTIDEIEDFENRLSYVRAGALIYETSGLFRGVRRFLDRFRPEGTRLYELSKSAGRYATLKEERTVKKEKMLDRLRVKVGRGKMDEYSHTSTKDLDRTGTGGFVR